MEIAKIVLNGQQGFKAWSQLAGQNRIDVLKRYHNLINQYRGEIIEAEGKNTLKQIIEIEGELNYSLDMLEHAIEMLEFKEYKQENDNTHYINEKYYTNRSFPFGLVVCVVPWNFPLVVAFERIPYMLAAGNAVIWKASETTGASATLLAQIFTEASRIPFVLQSCSFNVEKTKSLLKNKINYISFTGSTKVGHEIMCSKDLVTIPKSLELGGKNNAYVDISADIKKSAELLVNSFLRNNGHSCIQPSVAYIAESIYDSFKNAFINNIESKTSFQKMSPSYDQAKHKEKIDSLEKLIPGKTTRIVNPNSYFTPAALIIETSEGEIDEDEYFCPVITLIKTKDISKTIINSENNSYGLAAMLYANDEGIIDLFCKYISAGRLWINSEQKSIPSLRIGGLRNSGNCWICGENGLDDYMYNKAIVSATNNS